MATPPLPPETYLTYIKVVENVIITIESKAHRASLTVKMC